MINEAKFSQIVEAAKAKAANDPKRLRSIARLPGRRSDASGQVAPSPSTAPIELEKPPKPSEASEGFGGFPGPMGFLGPPGQLWELILAALTLIFIRNHSAATNARHPAREPQLFERVT